MIEVFATNVTSVESANEIVEKLSYLFPNSKINFDLSDVDNILRVEGSDFNVQSVIECLQILKFTCQPLV